MSDILEAIDYELGLRSTAQLLRKTREAAGLTHRQIAKMSGLKFADVQRIEDTRDDDLDIGQAHKYAAALSAYADEIQRRQS